MLNEFRQDIVSGEWVLFATGRAKRHNSKEDRKELAQAKEDCPFEDPEKFENEVLVTYPSKDSNGWFAKVAKNKYPAVHEGVLEPRKESGPFVSQDGNGFHELVIFGDHEKSFAQMSGEEAADIFKIYQDRYRGMAARNVSRYISVFHNQGFLSGATMRHPHSQMLAIPVLPPSLKRILFGSERFFKKEGKNVFDVIREHELDDGGRIVYENDDFFALCPFASRTPYEVKVFPKENHSHFEKMPAELLPGLGDMMTVVLRKIHSVLDNPDYNFYVHTAPMDNSLQNVHKFYAWHIEILPRTTMIGAFDLASGIDVNITSPEEAARQLREVK